MVRVERSFRLANEPHIGVCCDEGGLFVGGAPLFVRASLSDGGGIWRTLSASEINDALGRVYGLPVDVAAKVRGLASIAQALNKGDVGRAQILTLHLHFPDPPELSKAAGNPCLADELAARLSASGLLKADWDPAKHPHWPAGSPDGVGGQFAPVGAVGGESAKPSGRVVARFRDGPPQFVTHTDRGDAGLLDGVYRHPVGGSGDVSEFDIATGAYGPPNVPHFKPDPMGDNTEIFSHAADMRSVGIAREVRVAMSILERGYQIFGAQVQVRDQFGQLRIIDFLIGEEGDPPPYAAIEVKANSGQRNERQRTIDHNLEISGGTIVSRLPLLGGFRYGMKIFPHTTVVEVHVAHP